MLESENMPDKPTSRKRSGYDYASYFREMVVQHDLTTMPEDKKWSGVPELVPEPHSIVLYLGCNVLRTSHMIRTVTDVLDLLGLDYVAVGGAAYCCGIVHDRNGDKELAEAMGRNAVRFMERFQPERVAMWCPSCIFYYDEIFQVQTSFETLHVTELLLEHVDRFTFERQVPQRVALHYHNNHPRRLREAQAARGLLSAVPGLEYVEIESDTRQYLDRLQPDQLAKTISYTKTEGNRGAYPLWQLILHQANHQTHHRSEAAVMLTNFGHSPGDIDIMVYLSAMKG